MILILCCLLTNACALKLSKGLKSNVHATSERRGCTRDVRVSKLSDVKDSIVNHPPYTNKKKVLIKKDEIPHLTQMAFASFEAGSQFPTHDHESMFELFFVLNGTGKFTVTSMDPTTKQKTTQEVQASPYSFLHMPPGVQHSGEFKRDFQFLTLGVATDDKTCFKQSETPEKCPAQKDFRHLQVNKVAQETMEANPKCMKRTLLGHVEGLPNFLTVEEHTVPPHEALPIASMDSDAYSVYFVLEGSGQFKVNDSDEQMQIAKNSMVLLPPRVADRSAMAGTQGLRLLNIAIAEDEDCFWKEALNQ